MEQAPLKNVRTGFTRPLHRQQVISWVGYLLMLVCYLLFIFPYLTTNERIGISIPYLVFWAGFNIVFLIATCEKHRSAIVPDGNVVGSLRCQWCQRRVSVKSKHCRSCNLCRLDFDHHCFFLNNCVTKDNYGYFFSGIIMLFIDSVMGTLLSVYVIMGLALDGDNFDMLAEEFYGTKMPSVATYICLGLFLFMLLGIEVFLIYLLGLHTVLIYKNISTFDVIQFWREQKAEKAAKQAVFQKVESKPSVQFKKVSDEEMAQYLAKNNKQKKVEIEPHPTGERNLINQSDTSNAEYRPPEHKKGPHVAVEPPPEPDTSYSSLPQKASGKVEKPVENVPEQAPKDDKEEKSKSSSSSSSSSSKSSAPQKEEEKKEAPPEPPKDEEKKEEEPPKPEEKKEEPPKQEEKKKDKSSSSSSSSGSDSLSDMSSGSSSDDDTLETESGNSTLSDSTHSDDVSLSDSKEKENK